MVESRKRLCYFFWGLFTSFTSFCLICVSLATNYWVQSEPTKNSTLQVQGPSANGGKGFIHFGLFRVQKPTSMDNFSKFEVTVPPHTTNAPFFPPPATLLVKNSTP